MDETVFPTHVILSHVINFKSCTIELFTYIAAASSDEQQSTTKKLISAESDQNTLAMSTSSSAAAPPEARTALEVPYLLVDLIEVECLAGRRDASPAPTVESGVLNAENAMNTILIIMKRSRVIKKNCRMLVEVRAAQNGPKIAEVKRSQNIFRTIKRKCDVKR